MTFTNRQLDVLWGDLQKADRPFYVFIDERQGEVDSAWLDNNQQAIEYAKVISKKTGNIVNVLRYVGSSEGDTES